MRLRTTALVASAFAGLLFLWVPAASALPVAAREGVTTAAKTAGPVEEVRWRRGYRRWGYHRPYRYYRPYYRPYYYRPYYYGGWGYPYYGYRHWRRPGFGVYLGF